MERRLWNGKWIGRTGGLAPRAPCPASHGTLSSSPRLSGVQGGSPRGHRCQAGHYTCPPTHAPRRRIMTLLLSWVSGFLLEVGVRAGGKSRPGPWRKARLESHRSGFLCGPLLTLLICSPGSIWADPSRPESLLHLIAGSGLKQSGGGEGVWEDCWEWC